MNEFYFTRQAEKEFEDLEEGVQKRILDKLKDLKNHPDVLQVMRRLVHFEPATHRLRIGRWRLILGLQEEKRTKKIFWVYGVGHRKDIYR